MSTTLTWQVISIDSDETERLGELFGKAISAPALLELRADLGGGKTTFVRGLARGLESKDIVSSPTFTLAKTYKTKKGSLNHFDFYRLAEPGILKAELKEALEDGSAITAVEWSAIVNDVLPAERLIIEFVPTASNPDERQVTVKYPENLRSVITQVETGWEEVRP